MIRKIKRRIKKQLNKNCVEQKNDKYVVALMEKSGWKRRKASKTLYKAKYQYGIRYTDFVKYNLYEVPEDKFVATYQERKKLAKNRRKSKKNAKREMYIAEVMKRTGWDYEFTKEAMREAKARTKCDYKEYLIYKFYELDEKQQEEVFLIHDSKKILKKYDVNKEFVQILSDKEKTNLFFAEYMKRSWCVNTDVSLEEFKQIFSGDTKVIYKPINGNQGKGIKVYSITPENIEEVYEELVKLPKAVVEHFIVQHPLMSQMCPDSVNTIRIVTISSESKNVTPDGKHLDIAYAALRIGGGNSVVDNFHSGGMTAAVDIETGTLVTDATDMENNVYKTHPQSGCTIKGFTIPYFDEAVEMVMEICQNKKIEGYIGWDIAITESGPVIIEVNTRPGVVLLSMPWAIENKGMRHVMKKYLDA